MLRARGVTFAQRFAAHLQASTNDTRRYMGVLADQLNAKIQIVAEGIVGLTEKLHRDMLEGFETVDRRLTRLEARAFTPPHD